MSRLTHAELIDETRLESASVETRKGIARFQALLNHGKTALAEHHLEGGSSAALGRHQTWLVDQILIGAWQQFISHTDSEKQPSLIAAGGYGRKELNLESDIDLLLLLPDKTAKTVNRTIEDFVRFC